MSKPDIPDYGLPQRWRKRPVEIDAMQTGPDTAHDALLWVRAGGAKANLARDGCLIIQTLEGDMYADPGDWIIRGVQGEFYPCKPDIFEATYERVIPPGDGEAS